MTHTKPPDEIFEGEVVSDAQNTANQSKNTHTTARTTVDVTRILSAGCTTILLFLVVVVVFALLVGSVLPILLVLVLPFVLVGWWLSHSSRR